MKKNFHDDEKRFSYIMKKVFIDCEKTFSQYMEYLYPNYKKIIRRRQANSSTNNQP